MRVVKKKQDLRTEIGNWKKEGETVGLVPTMGFFHEGHLALMKAAASHADRIVTSIFVNPLQFGPSEDLDQYPRDLDRDTALAEKTGVDLLFIPEAAEMYPKGYQSTITVPQLTQSLCGKSRPGHFDGVATVVTKLFNLVQPDIAVFGRKDYQQLAMIKRMVIDLNFDIEIIGHPIIRESDGLAMSSRNKYLDQKARKDALCLSRGLQHARKKVQQNGSQPADQLIAQVIEFLSSVNSCKVDYVAIVDAETLEDKYMAEPGDVAALAAYFNEKVRLIDNIIL